MNIGSLRSDYVIEFSGKPVSYYFISGPSGVDTASFTELFASSTHLTDEITNWAEILNAVVLEGAITINYRLLFPFS